MEFIISAWQDYSSEDCENHSQRTKIESDKFGEHDKREVFYKLNEDAELETAYALAFETFLDGIYRLGDLRRNDVLRDVSDEDVLEASGHMKAIMEIMKNTRSSNVSRNI